MDEATGEFGGREPNVPDTWRFSIEVATRWEKAFFTANTPRTRKIALRAAMVMGAEHGGTFDLLLQLVRFGLGGKSGTGKQFVSWIHEDDFVRALDCLIEHEEFEGAVNVASPNPLANEEFMRLLRKAWGARLGFPASRWMLEVGAFFLRTETELILKSRRVVPGLLLTSGFEFRFPEWRHAAEDLVQRWRKHGGSA
jgi:NAD dependent epimerase/dehydratase family enzyme